MYIDTKFYCIQPLFIQLDLLSKLLTKKFDIESIKNSTNATDLPLWIDRMNELSNLYTSFVALNIKKEFDFSTFKSELKDGIFLVNNKYYIGDYIDENDTDYYLLFDYRLLQFVVIFELSFKIPKIDFENIIAYEENNLDFYNCVRNIYVKETDTSYVAKSILNLKNLIFDSVKQFIEKHFNIAASDQSISILNNSGNITNITFVEKKDTSISKSIIDLNANAERIPNKNPPIILDKVESYGTFNEQNYANELYYFNGRFHSIILHSKKFKYRYLPIQFHMQYLWFYLSNQLNLILERYNDDILFDDSMAKVVEYNEQIDFLINKVEIMNIFHQKFKLSIESDCEIYNIIENRWNIENMIKGSNNYINFFKDYLNRLYSKKTSKIEQKQNNLLLFISIFQFVALISVWNDYVSLLDDASKEKADEIVHLFYNSDFFEQFNVTLPLSFAIVIIIMLIYVFYKKE